MFTIRENNKYIFNEDYVELVVSSRTLGEYYIKIDKDDYDRVSKYKWHIRKVYRDNNNDFYVGYNSGGKTVLLHRFIMNCPENMVVDHINNDVSDNRKVNLQICTIKENTRKRKDSKNNKSGYKGVMWYPYRNVNKWMAYIKVDKVFINLGYYTNIEDAIKARRDAEIKYFGDYAPIE